MTSWECFCDEDQRGCLEFPSRMLSSWPSEGQLEELAAGCRALSSLEPSPDVVWLQREVLVSKALQAGAECPDYVRSFLEGSGTFPFGLTWEEAFAIPWLEIAVPLRTGSEEDPGLAMFLLGLMPEAAEKSPEPSFCAMARDSCKAAMNALSFAEKKTGRKFALLARHACSAFEGGSLALPIWLGAVALAEGLDPSPVLATGALDNDGRLLPVKGIEQKARLLKSAEAKRFVYPAASADRVPPQGFPIHRKEDALFLLEDMDERFWRTVHPFSYDPLFFWEQLPVITSWNRRRDWVAHALRYAKQCGSLELPEEEKTVALGRACGFLERFKDSQKDVCNEILDLFPLEWAKRQGESTDIFQLCQLHITRLSHGGWATREWEELAEQCRAAVQANARSVSPLFLEFYTRQCDSWYNLFFFEESKELLAKIHEERSRFYAYREQAVGKACGALCNGAAFRAAVKSSDGEYGYALELAKESEENFGSDRQGMLDKLRRDLDRAYIYWDRQGDGDRKLAIDSADRYIRATYEQDEEGNKPYAEALKARARADIRKYDSLGFPEPEWLQEDFRTAVEKSLEDRSKTRHPWMLYFYNAAITFQEDADLYRKCLERSYRLCEAGGIRLSTVSLLGLLPLSFLAEIAACRNFAVIEAERLLCLLRVFSGHDPEKAVMKGLFNRTHFEPLLSCSAEEALKKVREYPKRFFPFNYR